MRSGLMILMLAAALPAAQVTWTGWFSDEQCATARAQSGKLGPTNPECAETCLRNGKKPVFISEQAKRIFEVRGYSGVIGDLGYHVEVTADLDAAHGTIDIRSVKRLAYENLACGRRRKK